MINNDFIINLFIGGCMDTDSDDQDEDSLKLTQASNSGEDLHATAISVTHLNVDFQKEAALFLLKAKEEHRLTLVHSIACVHDWPKLLRHNIINYPYITQDITKLWSTNFSFLKQRITRAGVF